VRDGIKVSRLRLRLITDEQAAQRDHRKGSSDHQDRRPNTCRAASPCRAAMPAVAIGLAGLAVGSVSRTHYLPYDGSSPSYAAIGGLLLAGPDTSTVESLAGQTTRGQQKTRK
jgi:hypothetical protein